MSRRDLKKGIWYAALPGKNPLEKFQAANEAGFAGIELPSHLNQDEVLHAREATGVAVASVACGQYSRPLSAPSAAKRDEAVEGVKQAVRDAKRYAASSVLVVTGVVSAEVSYADAWDRNMDGLRRILPLAEESGVKLALENTWNHFLLSPLEAARFVDELKSPAAAWHFDIGNVIFLGWPEQWIRILGKRIHKLHVKEYSRKRMNEHGLAGGFAVEYLEGDDDWPAVMKALDDIGYRGWATAEPAWHPQGVDARTRLKQISEKMDKMFAL
jgi:L-ribulose-5-phosphate 3-epimerase